MTAPLDRETLGLVAWDASEADLAASPGFEAYEPQPWADGSDRPVGETGYGAMAVAVRDAVLEGAAQAAADDAIEARRAGFPVSAHEYVKRAKWIRSMKEAPRAPVDE